MPTDRPAKRTDLPCLSAAGEISRIRRPALSAQSWVLLQAPDPTIPPARTYPTPSASLYWPLSEHPEPFANK